MKKRAHFQEPVRVLMHLNGGYTKVFLERTEGVGMANGGIEWDVPTASIPAHLRAIGSRFIVICDYNEPEDTDTAEDIRATISKIKVEELS